MKGFDLEILGLQLDYKKSRWKMVGRMLGKVHSHMLSRSLINLNAETARDYLKTLGRNE